MTDQELINRLKRFATDLGSELVFTAADRIEELVKERDEARHLQSCACNYDTPTDVCMGHHALFERLYAAERAKLEAKLAKTVEALREISCKCVSNCDWERGDICPSWTIRKVLAELEGK